MPSSLPQMAVAPPRTRHLNVAVLADLHLGSSKSRATEVMAYLDSITPDTLVLAGDLMDLTRVRQGKLKQEEVAVLQKILDFAHSGSKVYYLTGNHDARLRKVGDLALGNLHIRQELQLQFDGHKHYFFHGDCLDTAVKYKLSAERTNSLSGKLLRLTDRVGSAVKKVLGGKKWSLATEVKTNPKAAEAYVELFEKAASTLARNKGCDHVICAHIHQPKIEQRQVGEKAIHYLNAGDWVDNLTALEYRFGKWKLYTYDTDDFPVPSKRLRIPSSKPWLGNTSLEEALMKTIISA